MRIGYPCQNLSVGCSGARTFRLASYSGRRTAETVAENLACLGLILRFNAERGIGLFRITSDLVPFASHPICKFKWQKTFRIEFEGLGRFIRGHKMRVCMHPDQFTLINSPSMEIFQRSVRELIYHAQVLDLMGQGVDAKIQIHVGGVYGDKAAGIARFIERARRLPAEVRSRLVVENDDRSYTLSDCLEIHEAVGLPVVLDIFHHRLNSSGQTAREAVKLAAATWGRRDGVLISDFSSQERGKRRGAHAQSIDVAGFKKYLADSRPIDLDIMLEIKDKEASALKALNAARRDPRLLRR